MFNLNDLWVINPLITRIVAPKSIQVIKRHLNNLDKGLNKFHVIKKHGKDIVTSSGQSSGYLLSECVDHEIRNVHEVAEFAFIEQKENEVYCLIIKQNEVALEVKSVESYIHMNALSLIIKLQKKSDGEVDVSFPVFLAGEVSKSLLNGIENTECTALRIESIQLPIDDNDTTRLQLTQNAPLPKIINSNKQYIAGGLIALLIVGSFFLGDKEKEEVKVIKVPESPFKVLNKILTRSGVSVKGRMIQTYVNLNVINEIEAEGWSLESVKLNSDSTHITLKHDGGSYERLISVANKNNFLVKKSGDRQILATNTINAVIMRRPTLIPLDQTLTYIEQGISNWLPSVSVEADNSRLSNQKWKETFLLLKYKNWGVNDFDTLGSITNGHPISFDNGTINHNEDGYNGVITLIIYGN
ncbi:hypothetical protein [Moritella sp. F3]|uniref:hypothetical protein n=1 Tax=Moritella sp. F3 TaxID=2718882 RepID=UPI0018E1BE08|nr:hypothetical protein [Moritella sp. F3]GIC77214.1 hypothetical protein FMO001_19410 [Moritella sp. F1]GIC82333.1 hypothetical protein FMO003_26140 [Moritella sp. F3]